MQQNCGYLHDIRPDTADYSESGNFMLATRCPTIVECVRGRERESLFRSVQINDENFWSFKQSLAFPITVLFLAY